MILCVTPTLALCLLRVLILKPGRVSLALTSNPKIPIFGSYFIPGMSMCSKIPNDMLPILSKDLALTLKGNTLILYSRVETHGEILYNSINSSVDDVRKVFFVHGGVDTEDREIVREITEEEENAIIVASYGTFSTGINIKRLHNIIFASPSKSRIRNLQSIGRVLRKGQAKDLATLYDVSDDITRNGQKNYTLNHLVERIKIYNEENFDYNIINVDIR